MDEVYISRLQRRKKKSGLKLFVLFITSVFFICLIFFWKGFSSDEASRIINPLGMQKITIQPTPANTINSAGLSSVVQHVLSDEDGTYGIYIKNLATGEVYSHSADKSFPSASLYKLWVMAVVYQQMESGKLQKSTVLSQDVVTLNNEFHIDSDVAEQTDGTITSSVDDALANMIDISDNYSALLLAEKVGLSQVTLFLKNSGLSHSTVGVSGVLDGLPTTTARDTGEFFEKLYSGDFADTNNTDEMLSLLKNQRLNEKMPKYLPQDVTIAHKTGELDSYSHDAGIVYASSGNYIFVVLTNSSDTDHANEVIAQISKDVYAYFTHS